MRKGKIAAQAGHACVTAILKALQRDGLLSCIHIEENGAITLPEDLPETPLTAWFTRGEAEDLRLCGFRRRASGARP